MYITISLFNFEDISENLAVVNLSFFFLIPGAVKPKKMPIASTIIIITIGVGVATMIGVIGNEIRLFIKDRKNGVDREKEQLFDYAMFKNSWGPHVL